MTLLDLTELTCLGVAVLGRGDWACWLSWKREREGKPSHMSAFLLTDVVIRVLQRNRSNRIYMCACVCLCERE